MDDADRAQIEVEREQARLMRARHPAGPAATGACLWCEEPLPDGRRWCDAACRNAWELMHARAPRR